MYLSKYLKTLKAIYLKRSNGTTNHDDQTSKVLVSSSEVTIVMRQLGLMSENDNNKNEFADEISDLEGLFGEEEPSLEEIWEAFKVFDENNDGLIDPIELGRVLSRLGYLKEELDIERCKKMISCFDGNNDGLLDFSDFLKFMQNCLC